MALSESCVENKPRLLWDKPMARHTAQTSEPYAYEETTSAGPTMGHVMTEN